MEYSPDIQAVTYIDNINLIQPFNDNPCKGSHKSRNFQILASEFCHGLMLRAGDKKA
jgi:hypothetical protein